jgi:hypothetical protein
MGEHIVEDKATGKKTFKNEGTFLMELWVEAEELEIFSSETVIDLLEFKWAEFGRNFHLFGCVMHFMYMTLLFVYIDQIYVNFNLSLQLYFNLGLLVGLIYPMFYEAYQIYRLGITEYISNPVQSLSDQLYVWCGIANVFSLFTEFGLF